MVNFKLNELKKEISELDYALKMTYTEFSKTEKIDNNGIYNIVKLYPNPDIEEKINNIIATNPTIKATNSSLLFNQSQATIKEPNFIQNSISTLASDINGSIKTIPPIEQEEPAKPEINTVPIGLGIAAAGMREVRGTQGVTGEHVRHTGRAVRHRRRAEIPGGGGSCAVGRLAKSAPACVSASFSASRLSRSHPEKMLIRSPRRRPAGQTGP